MTIDTDLKSLVAHLVMKSIHFLMKWNKHWLLYIDIKFE